MRLLPGTEPYSWTESLAEELAWVMTLSNDLSPNNARVAVRGRRIDSVATLIAFLMLCDVLTASDPEDD